MLAVFIIIGIIVILIIVFIVIYNRLVRMRNQARNAWAQVDVQLKRRHDLIPNLVEMVKGYKQYERQTLEAVTSARNLAQSLSGAGPAERAKAEGQLSDALGRLLAVAENYPDLKANQNFLSLQQELANTENNISSARESYNNAVLMCNNAYQVFPANIVAGMFGFKADEFFKVEETAEREAPKVNLQQP